MGLIESNASGCRNVEEYGLMIFFNINDSKELSNYHNVYRTAQESVNNPYETFMKCVYLDGDMLKNTVPMIFFFTFRVYKLCQTISSFIEPPPGRPTTSTKAL